MKKRLWLVAGAALVTVACSSKVSNQLANIASGSASGGRSAAGVLAFAAQGCAATWNGQPVTAEALTGKSAEMMAQAIRAMGGVQHLDLDNAPVVRVEAPPALAWSCAAPYVAAIGRSGAPLVALALAGDAGPPPQLGLALPNMPPPEAAIAIGAHGWRWNGASVDAAGLDRYLTQLGGAPGEAGEGPPPGLVRLEPDPDATLADIPVPARSALAHHLPPDLAADPAGLPAPVTPGGPPLLPPASR